MLTSGATTKDKCACGAPIWSYYEARHVRGVALTDLDWHWYFVCEVGHEQAEPAVQPVQMSLLELMT